METAQTTGEILAQSSLARERPRVSGKFLFVGDEKFWVRGVSYGTFRLDERGNESFAPEVAEKDFQSMAENGFNVICPILIQRKVIRDHFSSDDVRVPGAGVRGPPLKST